MQCRRYTHKARGTAGKNTAQNVATGSGTGQERREVLSNKAYLIATRHLAAQKSTKHCEDVDAADGNFVQLPNGLLPTRLLD